MQELDGQSTAAGPQSPSRYPAPGGSAGPGLLRAAGAGVVPGAGAAVVPASGTAPALNRTVHLVDVEEGHIRRAGDLVALVLSAVGVGLVLLVAVYGQGTAAGVTEDVQEVVNRTARQILLLPVTAMESLVVFLVPVSLAFSLLSKRRWRLVLQAVLAAVLASAVAWAGSELVDLLPATNPLAVGLTRNTLGFRVPAFSPFVGAIAGLLTVAGRGSSSRLVRWSWNALLVVLALAVLQGDQTIAGTVTTLLLGRFVGFALRYLSGVRSTRASGISLIRGMRRAGANPDMVVRLDAEDLPLRSWLVSSSAPVGHNALFPQQGDPDRPGEPPTEPPPEAPPVTEPPPVEKLADVMRQLGGEDDLILPDPLPIPPEVLALIEEGMDGTKSPGFRSYAVWQNGLRSHVMVMDGDRQVVGFLSSLWETLRIRGLNRRVDPTLRESAEHTALMYFAAAAAGVNVPEIRGLAQMDDSIILLQRHISGPRTLRELTAEELTDPVLDSVWQQLREAHDRGITHRNLAATRVVLDEDGMVWIRGWGNGEIASSELSRRFDLAQVLTMLALTVGTERSLASAARNLSAGQLASIAPLLQAVTMPAETRAAMRAHRGVLAKLREALTELIPTADAEPLPLRRFSLRQVLTVSVGLAAAVIVFGTLNFEEIIRSFRSANPWWLLGAFAAGLSTYFGAALGLTAFAPEKLGLWRTTMVQVASSIVSLVAPAGVGPAAIDIRFLTRQKVDTPLAVATVSLAQVSRFVVTVGMLLLVGVLSGTTGSVVLPSRSLLVGTGVVVALLGSLIAIPKVRAFALAKLVPILQQIWPRLVWILGQPRRLLLGVLGNVIMTSGYVIAFGFTLAAFGYSLPVATLSITYLASASAGSLVPSPAGIGPVELALTSGLTLAGIPSAIALSATLVFRVLTLWARVPLGYVALRHLQRTHDL